ncbi:tyrosine phosphatase family-domain-containing protein [Paraphoma chrysanthemicola]|uniref:Tyrosine phosphatase family-domain-containing protein n=1 Tax=Paraphoma chrysanthemicola TaxID=798071 RepID=A0A8K0RER4_9PLEO|nr:tyrosine phosphatase family-domain-containing protein [Paraphoma chrysanthemicola]
MSTQTLPHPPFYTVNNINNLRDAALHPLTTPNGPIRPGLLFRSAEVDHLTLHDWQVLRGLGIAHVFDLRSRPEIEKTWPSSDFTPPWLTDLSAAGLQRSWVPIFQEQDYSPEAIAQRYVKYMDEDSAGFVAAYRDMLHSGPASYAKIFRYFASDSLGANGGLVHCSAGKDRTGMFFGILFDYLGVPRGDIADEYNRTEMGLAGVREHIVTRLLSAPAFKNYVAAQAKGQALSREELAQLVADDASGKDFEITPEMKEIGRKAALRMVSARKESMLLTLEMLDREFGGSEKWLREKCGLSDAELAGLRKNLVVVQRD